MVAHTCTRKAEAGRSEVRGQPALPSKMLSQTLLASKKYSDTEQREPSQPV